MMRSSGVVVILKLADRTKLMLFHTRPRKCGDESGEQKSQPQTARRADCARPWSGMPDSDVDLGQRGKPQIEHPE